METVKSADGTVIAYDRAGAGPAAHRQRWRVLHPPDVRRAGRPQQRFTVVTYDRRGRGDSGDTEPFAPEREYEDLAAVAAATGSEPPFLFGHSSGAAIALRAAAAGLPAAGIVAYEAPFLNEDTPPPARRPGGSDPRAGQLRSQREAVCVLDVRGRQGCQPRCSRRWRAPRGSKPWSRLTPTLPYDIAVTDGGVPTAELAKITAPVLILGGKNSPRWFQRSVAEQAAATPGAQLMMLDGYDHKAPPAVITPILIDFFGAHR